MVHELVVYKVNIFVFLQSPPFVCSEVEGETPQTEDKSLPFYANMCLGTFKAN